MTAIPDGQIPELRRSIGVVFQDFKLLKRKSILENVAFVLRILAVPAREQKRRAFAALKSVGLHHKMHAYPLQLSGGEQQRVAIARALIHDPDIILAPQRLDRADGGPCRGGGAGVPPAPRLDSARGGHRRDGGRPTVRFHINPRVVSR